MGYRAPVEGELVTEFRERHAAVSSFKAALEKRRKDGFFTIDNDDMKRILDEFSWLVEEGLVDNSTIYKKDFFRIKLDSPHWTDTQIKDLDISDVRISYYDRALDALNFICNEISRAINVAELTNPKGFSPRTTPYERCGVGYRGKRGDPQPYDYIDGQPRYLNESSYYLDVLSNIAEYQERLESMGDVFNVVVELGLGMAVKDGQVVLLCDDTDRFRVQNLWQTTMGTLAELGEKFKEIEFCATSDVEEDCVIKKTKSTNALTFADFYHRFTR